MFVVYRTGTLSAGGNFSWTRELEALRRGQQVSLCARRKQKLTVAVVSMVSVWCCEECAD